MKPVGVYDPGPQPPDWVRVATIADIDSDEWFVEARQMSERRGILWVLLLGYHQSPAEMIGPHAATVRARLERTGLRPYVIAMSLGEEWYEQWTHGFFTSHGLPPSAPNGVDVIHHWLGRQHAAARVELPLPVLWVTTIANNDRASATTAIPYRPVPAHTDFVGVDAYVLDGGTFESQPRPILETAERTVSQPLVLIPQWFKGTDPDTGFYHGPRVEDAAQYVAWFCARPRWVAMLGYTWQNRLPGGYGLAGMPEIRAAVERALGVQ